MKALSFHQPRAEQILRGDKTLDIRTWQVSYRGILAVHASSQRRDDRCRALGFEPQALAYGALIGAVKVTDIVALDEEAYQACRDQHLLDTPFPGEPCYGWRLANPRRFDAPIPCRGRMRLFDVGQVFQSAVGQAFQPAVGQAFQPGGGGQAFQPAVGQASQPGGGGQAFQPAVGQASQPGGGGQAFQPAVGQAFQPGGGGQAFQPAVGQASQPGGGGQARSLSHVEADPEHPFVLYAIPDGDGSYRVALYQWLSARSEQVGQASKPGKGALWSIELGGDPLRAVADHLLAALRANGHKATDLSRAAGVETPFYLDELTGLRLALILMAARPLTRHDRIEAIGLGVQAMSAEEAYYWFSKCSAGPDALRAQKALRILLADE
ncbi:MAG: DUF7680 family protein [Chloroflexota bacterium]